ncbi:hypothetical protein [Glycocaulis sp.]
MIGNGAVAVAIIDDDPVETDILSILMSEVFEEVEVESFLSVSDFLREAERARFNLIFLDRRLPPYSSFDETLPLVAPAAGDAVILLVTAHTFEKVDLSRYKRVVGPFAKLDLMTPEDLKGLLEKHMGAAN